MGATTLIFLDPDSESFIQKQLKTGRYVSPSDVIEAGLRLLEKEEKQRMLRDALIDGEQSGWVYDFDPGKFKARMRAKNNS